MGNVRRQTTLATRLTPRLATDLRTNWTHELCIRRLFACFLPFARFGLVGVLEEVVHKLLGSRLVDTIAEPDVERVACPQNLLLGEAELTQGVANAVGRLGAQHPRHRALADGPEVLVAERRVGRDHGVDTLPNDLRAVEHGIGCEDVELPLVAD